MDTLSQQRVFIVDDDHFCREMYSNHLATLGITKVHSFNNGEDCIDNMFLNPNIIFVDYDMDALNGIEVIGMVKTTNPDTHIILVSAQRDIDVVVKALKKGAFYYINKNDKPLEKMSSVLSELSKLISNKTVHQA